MELPVEKGEKEMKRASDTNQFIVARIHALSKQGHENDRVVGTKQKAENDRNRDAFRAELERAMAK